MARFAWWSLGEFSKFHCYKAPHRGGQDMNSAARIIGVVAAASLVGCNTGTGLDAGTDAGPDAGTVYGIESVGTATFTGAETGTYPAVGFAWYSSYWEFSVDGGYQLAFTVVASPNGPPYFPAFTCGVSLPGEALEVGDFTVTNVRFCGIFDPRGASQSWYGSTVELNVGSTGPVQGLGPPFFDGGSEWSNPTATLTVDLLPYPDNPAPYDAGVSVTVMVAPR